MQTVMQRPGLMARAEVLFLRERYERAEDHAGVALCDSHELLMNRVEYLEDVWLSFSKQRASENSAANSRGSHR